MDIGGEDQTLLLVLRGEEDEDSGQGGETLVVIGVFHRRGGIHHLIPLEGVAGLIEVAAGEVITTGGPCRAPEAHPEGKIRGMIEDLVVCRWYPSFSLR